MSDRRSAFRAVAAVLAVLFSLVCAGCGARVAPDLATEPWAGTSIVAESSQTAPPAGEQTPLADGSDFDGQVVPGADATALAAAPLDGVAPSPAGSPSPAASVPPSHHNDGTVRLSVTPSCARPGGVLRVTFAGPPHADVNGVVAWPDGSSRFSDRIFGRSDASGHYVWPLPVPVDTSPGEGTILGGMTGTDRYGSADVPFTIAPDC